MVSTAAAYRIVKLANGTHSIHSLAHAETFHPVVGPATEAEALYVKQLRLTERLASCAGEFVVWDVGLGAAANPVTFLRLTSQIPSRVRVVSFDHTLEPLRFALANTRHLPYLEEYREPLGQLLAKGRVAFANGAQTLCWDLVEGDFPSLVVAPGALAWPKPHVVMFDAFSPATNPAMWTQPLFASLFRLLDPGRPCALPTYSRSTMLRVTLLLAGFFVGVGHPTGSKEETTVAANSLALVQEPLKPEWLKRAARSHSAEPMWEPVYRQARLSEATRLRLEQHPQLQASAVIE